jgi:site-specific DNA-methyltransferase (adenine-specific)
MPTLQWDSKNLPAIDPAVLEIKAQIYPQGFGYPQADPENKLIWGDNLAVMSALLQDYEEAIDLIYVDPPFYTNRRYQARVGRGEDSRRPEEWLMAEGYQDHWLELETYLDMLYPRLVLMHRLLSPTGTLYLHLDWHANAYARLLLDEIFGSERLLNEIVWIYHGPSPIRSAFNRKHDTILSYTKSKRYTFNVDAVRQPYDESTRKTFASSTKAGFGKVPDLERGKVPEDWWYFPVVARLHTERTGYPTQKPEGLLERILLASSNSGDLVADFFCGSGTFATVAARHGRRFIANDATWRALHTTRSRLVTHSAPPFSLLAAQKYSLYETYEQIAASGIHLENDDILLGSDLITDLDYWEVDPAWDGQIFRSAAQAVRAPRKKYISPRLKLPPPHQERPVAVHLVKVNGDQHQFTIPAKK